MFRYSELYKFLCFFIAVALLSGCSLFKVQRASVPAAYDDNGRSRESIARLEKSEKNRKDRNKERDRAELNGKIEEAENELGRDSGTAQKYRPVITFTEPETQHVRFQAANRDPFNGSGELVYPLQELADEFCYPLKGKFISKYGMRGRSMHTGIDIKAALGDTIRAAMPGVVRMSKLYSGYGNVIVIRHYNGLETVYAHQTKNLVSANDAVEAGDPLGLAGRTGRATTEHLHFEVRAASEHFNPVLLVDPETHSLRTDTLYVYRSNNGKVLAYNTDKSGEINRSASDGTAVAASQKVEVKSFGNQQQAVASGQTVYHTVKKGDTLSAIALKYSTTVNKLCALNNITPKKILQINQKLRVK